MEEIIRVQDNYYILATSSRVEQQARVLKHGDTFAVLDRSGNIQQIGLGEQGLYHGGSRHLSRLEMRRRLGELERALRGRSVRGKTNQPSARDSRTRRPDPAHPRPGGSPQTHSPQRHPMAYRVAFACARP